MEHFLLLVISTKVYMFYDFMFFLILGLPPNQIRQMLMRTLQHIVFNWASEKCLAVACSAWLFIKITGIHCQAMRFVSFG